MVARGFIAQEICRVKKSIRSTHRCVLISAMGAMLASAALGGCASSDTDHLSLGYDAYDTRRPYTPNLYDSTVSGVEYHVSVRTSMVEGQSSLTTIPYRMNPEQRQAVEQLRELRASYGEP